MTITGKLATGMLSLVGLIAFSIPTFGAEGSGGGKQDAQTSRSSAPTKCSKVNNPWPRRYRKEESSPPIQVLI